jgi:membrane protease YdiL (CAAX protease family)
VTAVALPVVRLRIGLLLTAFAVAVLARLVVAGPGPAQSPVGGLVFAGLLLAVAAAARTRVPVTRRAVSHGAAGAVLLAVPVALLRLGLPLTNPAGLARWLLVVAVVATAEEVFLRGTLYDAVPDKTLAICLGACAFALLHVPLYGWHVVPLDLVVGLVLGELRRSSGTAAAPAIAHVGADAAAWFLR